MFVGPGLASDWSNPQEKNTFKYAVHEQDHNITAAGSGGEEDVDGILLPPAREWSRGYSSLLCPDSIGAGILTLSLAVSKIGWGFGMLMYVFFSGGCFGGATSSI